MAKKFAKVLIVIIMLFGLVFSTINFVTLNKLYAFPGVDRADGNDVIDEEGTIIDCIPGGAQCRVIGPIPPIE